MFYNSRRPAILRFFCFVFRCCGSGLQVSVNLSLHLFRTCPEGETHRGSKVLRGIDPSADFPWILGSDAAPFYNTSFQNGKFFKIKPLCVWGVLVVYLPESSLSRLCWCHHLYDFMELGVFFFMFWLCWVFTAWGFVELQRAGGPQAPCGRWTFHCCGFSCYGAQALGFSCSLAAVIRLQCGRPGFDPWVGKMPWRREWLTHSSILAWRIPWTV